MLRRNEAADDVSIRSESDREKRGKEMEVSATAFFSSTLFSFIFAFSFSSVVELCSRKKTSLKTLRKIFWFEEKIIEFDSTEA